MKSGAVTEYDGKNNVFCTTYRQLYLRSTRRHGRESAFVFDISYKIQYASLSGLLLLKSQGRCDSF